MKSPSIRVFAYLRKRTGRDLRAPKTRSGISLKLGLIAALMATGSYGQGQSVKNPPPIPKMTRPPLSHVYLHFLLYQNHLDKVAATREEQGKDGSWLRDHFQQRLGFTGSQFAVVRSTGLRLESELKEIEGRAKAIAQADLAAHPRTPNNLSALPAPNPQLRDLTKEREELIQREVAKLDEELGPEPAAKLQAFLESNFLQNATGLHPHPRPHDPKLPVQSLHNTVQP
jgi:hypothetical protein